MFLRLGSGVPSSKPAEPSVDIAPSVKALARDSMNNSNCVSRNSVIEMDVFRQGFLDDHDHGYAFLSTD
jgi:hypothetical protein